MTNKKEKQKRRGKDLETRYLWFILDARLFKSGMYAEHIQTGLGFQEYL